MKIYTALRYPLFLAILTSMRVMACPGCKDSKDPTGSFWMSGYNWSIVFLLLIVGVLVGAFVYNIYKIVKREAAASAGDAAEQHAGRGNWSVITLPACGAIVAVLMILGQLEATPAPAHKYATESAVRAALAVPDAKVLLMFKADNCSVCVDMAPTVAKLEKEYAPKLTLVYCNPKESKALAKEFNVDNLPCSILLAGGKETSRREGFRTEAEMRAWLGENTK